ncbi:hypothetical protein CR513_18620, partial [Mucuna pruriens]
MGKFDTKSDKGTFLGYSNVSKAYKLYNSRTVTIEEFIHVGFNDSKLDNELSQLNDFFADLNLEDIFQRTSFGRGAKRRQNLGYLQDKVRIRSTFKDEAQVVLLFELEPKNIKEALMDDGWKLVSLPKDKSIIGTKWFFINKLDENGKVIKNKARRKVDTTLFHKNYDSHLIIVQIYVDDIIFGATNESLCEEFYKIMQKILR